MDEKEIEKILKPTKKLIILFVMFITLAVIFIGLVFVMKFSKKEGIPLDLSSKRIETENQFVKIESDSLPILFTTVAEKDKYFYYVKDIYNHVYVVNISADTFKNITETIDMETGKLTKNYVITGYSSKIDEKTKELALTNSYRVFKEEKVTSDNFSEYFGEFYIKENVVSNRRITLYTISALFGLFLLIVAFGYILPSILKVRKRLGDKELVEELRKELNNLTVMPYKEYHLYLTRNYLVSGIQIIKYEDIIGAYVSTETSHFITVGKNLNVYTKDEKKHVVASVKPKDEILDSILDDLQKKNENIVVGYSNDDKEIIENLKNRE